MSVLDCSELETSLGVRMVKLITITVFFTKHKYNTIKITVRNSSSMIGVIGLYSTVRASVVKIDYNP